MKKYSLILLAFSASGLLAGCGKADSANNTPQTPQTPSIRSVSAEERARYCFLDANLDTEEAQSKFIDRIQGTWVHQAQGADESSEFKRREFMFDANRKIVAVTTYSDYDHQVDDITFNRVCVSRPLDSSYGQYAGFRSVEVMAANNEGEAAVFVKYETDGTGKTLTVSARFYERFNNTSGVLNVHSVLSTGGLSKLWVYPVRQ